MLLRLGEWEYRREIARRMGFGPVSPLASAPLLQRGELAEEVLWSRIAGRPVAADAFDDAWLANFPVDDVDDIPEYVEAVARLGMRGVLHRGDAEATRGCF